MSERHTLYCEQILLTIEHFINSDVFPEFINRQEDYVKYLFSFFALYYDIQTLKGRLPNAGDYIVRTDNHEWRLVDIVKTDYITMDFSSVNDFCVCENNGKIRVEARVIPVGFGSFYEHFATLVFLLANNYHTTCYCTKEFDGIQPRKVYKLSNNEFDEKDVKLEICDIKDMVGHPYRTYYYVNYVSGFPKLRIASNKANSRFTTRFVELAASTQKIEKILSPYIFEDEYLLRDIRSDKFYSYVAEQTGNKKEDVINEYDRFVKELNMGEKYKILKLTGNQ